MRALLFLPALLVNRVVSPEVRRFVQLGLALAIGRLDEDRKRRLRDRLLRGAGRAGRTGPGTRPAGSGPACAPGSPANGVGWGWDAAPGTHGHPGRAVDLGLDRAAGRHAVAPGGAGGHRPRGLPGLAAPPRLPGAGLPVGVREVLVRRRHRLPGAATPSARACRRRWPCTPSSGRSSPTRATSPTRWCTRWATPGSAPIVQALINRGVKFHFFHRVWDLLPGTDAGGRPVVDGIVLEQQVEDTTGPRSVHHAGQERAQGVAPPPDVQRRAAPGSGPAAGWTTSTARTRAGGRRWCAARTSTTSSAPSPPTPSPTRRPAASPAR